MTNDLYSRLFTIGIQVTGKRLKMVDIESTLIDACYEIENDSRLLSLLFAWVEKYSNLIIISKFLKTYKLSSAKRGKCPWVAALLIMTKKKSSLISSFLNSDDFSCMSGSPSVVKIQAERHGAIAPLKSHGIIVPKNFIRIRDIDVAAPDVIAKRNLQFKNRLLIGATARADVITAIMLKAENPYQAAQMANVAYSFANKVFNEVKCFKLEKLASSF